LFYIYEGFFAVNHSILFSNSSSSKWTNCLCWTSICLVDKCWC